MERDACELDPFLYGIPDERREPTDHLWFGPRGEFVCVNYTTPRIRILDPSGSEIARIEPSSNIRQVEVADSGLFVCSNAIRRIEVVDSDLVTRWNVSVTHYDWSGAERWTCALPSIDVQETCVVEDRHGGIFVGGDSGHIVRVDENGTCVLVWKHPHALDITCMAMDKDDHLVAGFRDMRNSRWDEGHMQYVGKHYVSKRTLDLEEIWTSQETSDPIVRVAVREDRVMVWSSLYGINVFDANTGYKLRHIDVPPFYVQDLLFLSKRTIRGISWDDLKSGWYSWTCDIDEENDRVRFAHRRIERILGDDTLYAETTPWPALRCIAKCPRTGRVYGLSKSKSQPV